MNSEGRVLRWNEWESKEKGKKQSIGEVSVSDWSCQELLKCNTPEYVQTKVREPDDHAPVFKTGIN